ncbi:S-layer homology domain-containing protein [Paenibacillus sp. HB172176]|uniref:S-layer homology domain-containing protein n=1 Tax=Paenibacillus sp. HB172176 TaxID=2493690 RepID=UPI00143C0CF9|nr:S-layer homology domain-containing protein [Paenibacillus sp. HB172176]
MPKQDAWKKIVTGALAVTLVTGSGAAVLSKPVATYAAAYGSYTPFTDVAWDYWAEKHIAKLYLQGVINGYQTTLDGPVTFKPENSVSQQEAVLMALRFTKLDTKADHNALIVFDKSFKVGEFYKEYIEVAFSEGLLDRSEEYALAAAEPDVDWGSKPASREWTTKLIVRAMGQAAIANQLGSTETRFDDDNSIDSLYRGYVNAAVQLGLVKGVTETTFAPELDVTRASLATLFSRAESTFPVTFNGQINGVVTDMTASSLTVYNSEEDKEQTYAIDSATLFYRFDSESPATMDDVLQYGDVTVFAKDGKALYVEVQGTEQHTSSITGTFISYNEEDGVIYILVDGKPVPLAYHEDLAIKDTDGNVLSIDDLKATVSLTIVQDDFREEPEALEIIMAAKPAVTSISGLFYANASKTVTLQMADGSYVTKPLATDAKVEINGLPDAVLSDLIAESDQVELSLNNEDQIVKIKVLNRDLKVLAGVEIEHYNEELNYISLVDVDGNVYSPFYFTDKTKFSYFGNAMEKEAAMNLGAQNVNVVVKYSGKNIVSFDYVLEYTGVVSEINMDAKMITLQTRDGGSAKISYATSAYEDMLMPKATIQNLKIGDTVTANLNMKELSAINIRVHHTIQYQVVTINLADSKINVKNAEGNVSAVSIQDVDILNEDGTAGKASSLKVGGSIEMTYNGNSVSSVKLLSSASNG